jgi:uncharacterized LabA/DUF88 family protein
MRFLRRGIQQMKSPREQAIFARPTRRMMVFVDGENLVFRYQNMVNNGFVPRDEMKHEPDVFVWFDGFTHLGQQHEIIRTTYYTYVVGDDLRVTNIRNQLRSMQFSKHMASLLPNTLSPCVFKKDQRSRSGKGVDIQLSVDMMSHVFRGNVDSILLLSGDGDYAPLLDEVKRAGILVYVSAFSDGFSSSLKDRADAVYELDGTTWK